jgi:hypothetical protein
MNKPKISPMAIFNTALIAAFLEIFGTLAINCFFIYPISALVSVPPLAFSVWLLCMQITHLQRQPLPQRQIKSRIFDKSESEFWFDFDTGYTY